MVKWIIIIEENYCVLEIVKENNCKSREWSRIVRSGGWVEGYTGSQHLTNALWTKDDRGEHDDSDDDDYDDGDVQDGYETWVKAEVC